MKGSIFVGTVCLLVSLIIVFSSSNVVVPFGGPDSAVARNNGHQMVPADSHTPHGPITISSNADFSSQGWPGSGTSGDPYVIEGLNITADAVCINITDTTVYFEVKDCVISSASSSSFDGIFLENVTYGTVRDCIINQHHNGIYLYTSDSCTLTNNTATSNSNGIYLLYSDDCTLTNNTATSNFRGFWVRISDSCTLTNNTATDNDYGFWLSESDDSCTLTNNTATSNSFYGFYVHYSENCTLTNNTLANNGLSIVGDGISDWLHDLAGNWVNGKPLGYFKSVSDVTIDGSQYGQVILANCSNVTVKDGTFMHSSVGIQLGYCMNCALTNNIASSNHYGFHLSYSTNCTLTNNVASSNSYDGFCLRLSDNCTLTNNIASSNSRDGFRLLLSDNCTLTNNTATSNSWGFYVRESGSCTLTQNTATSNGYGFYVFESANCMLTQNTASSNSGYGIYLDGVSEYNILYLNRLGNNGASNARDDGASNIWDDGVSSGNYWMDYNGTGTNQIPGSAESVDNYPFIWDTTVPTVDSPLDLEYIEGESGDSITWTPSDDHPENYSIYRNDTVIASGFWDGSQITVDVDGLSHGVYNYTLVVTDIGGNTRSDEVIVTVVDGTLPFIDNPVDFQYNEFATGYSITWDPSDAHPVSYVIYLEGTPVKSGAWNSSSETITISADGHGLGTYNYTIVVTDVGGNTARDEVLVTIVDGTVPTVDSPADFQYEEGQTGNVIIWNPDDLHPASCEILKDGNLLQSEEWTSTTEAITVSVNGLAPGVYNYTIVVTDVGGNTAVDVVIVTVTASATTTSATTTETTTYTTDQIPPPDSIMTIVVVGAGAAGVIVIIFLLMKKRK